MGQQPAFDGQSAAKTDEGTIGADHAVARHNDGDGVGTIGLTHGAGHAGRAQLAREPGIAPGLTEWDEPQSVPDASLERRPLGGQLQLEGLAFTGEIFVELGLDRGQRAGVGGSVRAREIETT